MSWQPFLSSFVDHKFACSSHLQMSRALLLFWIFEPDLKVVKNKMQKVYSSHYQSRSLFILTDEIVFAWNWLLRMSRKEWSVVIMGWYVWCLWDVFKYCAGWQRSGQRGFKQWGLGEGTFLWRRKGDEGWAQAKKDRGLKKGKVIPNPLPRQVVSLRIRLAGTKSYLTVYFKRQESCEAPCWNFDDLSNSVGEFSHS